jgi:hypothetical protein
VSVSWTRQKGGRFAIGFGASAPGAAGGVNWPLVTARAAVIFAFVSFSDAASVSQVAASARAGARKRHETKAKNFMVQSL